MSSYDDKIKELEDELKKTKYNKATQHHIGLVKAKIAQLKERQEQKSGSGKKGEGYSVRKSGDATVVLLGFPSVGKSTLINKLTDADSKVGAYDFTTLTVIPGAFKYEGADIQILDIPGIIRGAAQGKGRGKEIFSVLRSADLVIILVDVKYPGQLKIVQKEMHEIGLRLNKLPPDVRIKKTSKGGINIILATKKLSMQEETIKGILKEFRINNADITIREDINEDDLIDVLEANKVYVPAIVVLNKIDLVNKNTLKQLQQGIEPDLCISADNDIGLDELKRLIFEKLNLIRIYCKQPGKKADMKEALILKHNASVGDVCDKLHRDFKSKFKYARVWGSARFPGLKIRRLDYMLKDKDVVELHMR
ncbi:GTP-binding protein [Candidatus Woesearchaeota archaeon]|nr:GTP-binding protein [Candidatus Woesearchaeota archaeon]